MADGKPASVQRSLSSEDGVQICDPSGSPLLLWSKDNVITRCDGTSQLDMKQHNTLTLFSTSPGEGKWIWIDPKTLLLMTEHQSFLLDVSGEDLKIRSTIDHCLGYESGKDCFIVGDMQQKSATLGLIPRYSVEMLVEKGQVILGK